MVPEFHLIACFDLDVEQGLQPLGAELIGLLAVRILGFIEPVGGDPGLGHDMHGLGAHLEFDVDTRRTHQGGMY